jgi:cytochrome P450
MRYKVGHLLLASRRKEIKRMGSWLSKLSSERAKLGNDVEQKDIFYAMLNAVDPKTEKSFSGKEMWTESMLLLVGGERTVPANLVDEGVN